MFKPLLSMAVCCGVVEGKSLKAKHVCRSSADLFGFFFMDRYRSLPDTFYLAVLWGLEVASSYGFGLCSEKP